MEKITLSTYLTKSYIEVALAKAFQKPSLVIQDYEIKPGSESGENFCSAIYRVSVRYEVERETHVQTFIVKDLSPMLVEIGSNEWLVYESVLPAMESILRKAAVPAAKLSPVCHWKDNDKKELYILEDLNSLGYRPADRMLGLDFAHAKVLLEKTAKFHAASMLYVEQCPDVLESLRPSIFANGLDPLMESVTVGNIEYAVKVIKQWGDDFNAIASKMNAHLKTFEPKIMELVDPKQCRLKVISHGDLWVNNCLFSYEDENPKDMIFVDFQMCFWGSLGYDLNFLLFTSVQLNVLQKQRYELLRHYYRCLKSTLIQCGAKSVPTWEQIVAEIRYTAFIGYYATVCELPLCCMDAETSQNFSTALLCDNEAMQSKRPLMYRNKRVLETLRYALDYFDELGILD